MTITEQAGMTISFLEPLKSFDILVLYKLDYYYYYYDNKSSSNAISTLTHSIDQFLGTDISGLPAQSSVTAFQLGVKIHDIGCEQSKWLLKTYLSGHWAHGALIIIIIIHL